MTKTKMFVIFGRIPEDKYQKCRFWHFSHLGELWITIKIAWARISPRKDGYSTVLSWSTSQRLRCDFQLFGPIFVPHLTNTSVTGFVIQPAV